MPEGMRELSPVLSPYYQCEVGSDPEAAAVVDPTAVQTVYRNQKQLAAVFRSRLSATTEPMLLGPS